MTRKTTAPATPPRKPAARPPQAAKKAAAPARRPVSAGKHAAPTKPAVAAKPAPLARLAVRAKSVVAAKPAAAVKAPLTAKAVVTSAKAAVGKPAAAAPKARTGGVAKVVTPISGIERRVNMPEDRQSQLKLLIARGKEQGYLTYAQVNDHLPSEIVDPEQIEDIVNTINDMGIPVYEKAPDSQSLLAADAAAPADEEAIEEAFSTNLSIPTLTLSSGASSI